MKHDISKLCADSLRSFLSDNFNIKLKSAHAHEIVAAFFGYKSKIALLDDKQFSISNLDRSKFILLEQPTPFINQRINSLKGLSPELPSSYILAEGIYSIITSNTELLEKIQPSLDDLAVVLSQERLQQHIEIWRMNFASQWITDVKIKTFETHVLMAVTFYYFTDTGERSRYCKIDTKLPRIAANIGYGTPEIVPTFYSGQFRDPDFNPDFGMNAEAQL